MALLGAGVLAIWNDIAAGVERDFGDWHVSEHFPERVGLTGFLRGRRYANADASPAYFNFYEADTPEVFQSPAYQARLNDPTPWTRQVVSHFHNTSRTVCDVVFSHGQGDGGWILTVQMSPGPGFSEAELEALAYDLVAIPQIVGAHLLRGRAPPAQAGTAETALRGGPDHVAELVLLIEAASEAALQQLTTLPRWRDGLAALALSGELVLGRYNFAYGLTHDELSGRQSG
jgi:hypothetical protein